MSSGDEGEGSCGVGHVHVERDEELRGGDGVPYAEVDDAVVAHEPSQGHVDTFECRCAQVGGQASAVGVAAVGLS